MKSNKMEQMDDSTDKIKKEKVILSQLKNKRNKFLPYFYYTTQEGYKESIFCQFYQHKSLRHWLSSYGYFSSMFTKISLCLFICYGAKFLHENSIIHRDLKLANILIDPKPSIKIIDFGEAFHPNVEKMFPKLQKPGCSIPSSPPQAYSQYKVPQPSFDIFSIGVIMMEILFGIKLFDKKNEEAQKDLFRSASKQFDSEGIEDQIRGKFFFAFENITSYGPQ